MSGFVSSSRTTNSTGTFFPPIITPPAALISLTASLAPSSCTGPIGEAAPVMPNMNPTLILSGAAAPAPAGNSSVKAAASAIPAIAILFAILIPLPPLLAVRRRSLPYTREARNSLDVMTFPIFGKIHFSA